MKRKLKRNQFLLIATILFVFQSGISSAQSNINISLFKPGTEVAEIRIDDLKADEVLSLSLRNDDDIVLFSDETKGSRYVKMLNFAQVRNGKYTLDVAKERGVVRRVIVKDEQGLSIEDESYVFHNYVKYKDEDKKVLVKFNNRLNEPVTIRITDDEGRILHEETNIRMENYAALFNLSRLNSGSYNMNVTSGNFSKNRKIQL